MESLNATYSLSTSDRMTSTILPDLTSLNSEEDLISANSSIQEQSLPFLLLATREVTYKYGVGIHTYVLPFITVTGLIGNGLSLTVMCQPKNRRFSGCIYMIGLAINDLISLTITVYHYSVTIIYPNRPVTDAYLTWECKILSWIFHYCSFSGVLIILAMTLDKVIAVKLPLKAKTICTPRRAKIFVCVLWFFTATYSSPQIYGSGLLYLSHTGICSAYVYSNALMEAYSWINIVVNAVVPLVGLFVMNSVIIFAIRKRGKYFQSQQSTMMKGGKSETVSSATTQDNRKESARERQLTFMLLLVSFALLILTLPNWIRFVVYTYRDMLETPRAFADFVLYYHVGQKFFYINNSVNFFLYCIGGSKFRGDVKEILTCCKSEGKKPQGHSEDSMTRSMRSTDTLSQHI